MQFQGSSHQKSFVVCVYIYIYVCIYIYIHMCVCVARMPQGSSSVFCAAY